ncbi:MAG: hypothetical protein ACLPKB_07160 [Xanthobacteraceae bacterium]
MSTAERLSISLKKERAAWARKQVAQGRYPNISATVDAALDALAEMDLARDAWWVETLLRCEEAEQHPEQMLSADDFHARRRERIKLLKRQASGG